jgi:hypothetical protein
LALKRILEEFGDKVKELGIDLMSADFSDV